jgi:hypothetical protein
MLARKSRVLVTVALANKMAQIVWAMLTGDTAYLPSLSVKAT